MEERFADNYLLYLLARASTEVSKQFHSRLKHHGLQVSEWEWEVSEVESGMYFAHVSAIDNSNRSTDIIKIAVIH